jgi:hypothetical protein
MNNQRLIGIVVLLVGVGLTVVGMNASDSIADRFSNFFTGHFTDATVWYLVVGISCILGGILMTTFNAKQIHS